MSAEGVEPDVDELACRLVMARHRLSSPTAAINYALRSLATAPLSPAEVRRLRVADMDVPAEPLREPTP